MPDVTKREFMAALAGITSGLYVGQLAAGDDSAGMVGGIVGGGGGDTDAPPFQVDAGDLAGPFAVASTDDLSTPPSSPAAVVTLDAGLLLWTADATDGSSSMPTVQEFKTATTIDDLEAPDNYPAVAITADEGLLIDLGGN